MDTKKRDERMRAMREKGKTLREIGDRFNISRERVRQILLPKKELPTVTRKCVCGELFQTNHRSKRFCPACSEAIAPFSGRDRTREIVRIRDNKTCQSCNTVWKPNERRFDVHHLNGLCGKMSTLYDDANNLEGLVTLCHKCHMSKHAIEKMKEREGKMTSEKREAATILYVAGWSTHKIARVLGAKQSNVFYMVTK